MSRTRIKICGITDIDTGRAAIDAGADFLGLVIDIPKSPRNLDLRSANRLADALGPHATLVTVVQNPLPQLITTLPCDWIQLHGNENEADITRAAASKRVIKGFRYERNAVRRWDACDELEALLVDGSSGGAGEPFDHAELAEIMSSLEKHVILAGGLTPENIGEAVRAVRPWAVDVSSGVESSPGVKDHDLIRAFCAAVRNVDASLR